MSILYTVMPLDLVWGSQNYQTGASGAAGMAAPAAAILALGDGRFVEIESGPAGPVLRRLHSSNPLDYLDPRLQPGSPQPWRQG